MTVGELIEHLEQYDEDMEVRLMTQPSWPLQCGVQGVVAGYEIDVEVDSGEQSQYELEDEAHVFLLEGRGEGYGTRYAW